MTTDEFSFCGVMYQSQSSKLSYRPLTSNPGEKIVPSVAVRLAPHLTGVQKEHIVLLFHHRWSFNKGLTMTVSAVGRSGAT